MLVERVPEDFSNLRQRNVWGNRLVIVLALVIVPNTGKQLVVSEACYVDALVASSGEMQDPKILLLQRRDPLFDEGFPLA